MWVGSGRSTLRASANEELGTLADNNPLTCTCSQYPTEAMLWIKEVEMVDSVEDLKSSSSTRGIQMPNF